MADRFVSPSGSMSGLGTIDSPWGLSGTLSDTGRFVLPGDILYLRSGIYTHPDRGTDGRYFLKLSGTTENPIVVRPYQREHVTINGGFENQVNSKRPCNVIISGLEFWLAESTGIIASVVVGQNYPYDLGRPYGGMYITAGHNIQVINNIFHGTLNACYLWGPVSSGLVYGNIYYNNGYQAADANHGPCLYGANNLNGGIRRVIHNVLIKNYDANVQLYGSSSAYVTSIILSGNIACSGMGDIINNHRDNRVLVGTQGGDPYKNSGWIISRNYVAGTNIQVTYPPNSGMNIIAVNNYGARGSMSLPSPSSKTGQWLGTNILADFTNYSTGIHVLIYPNLYDSGRAHIAVSNMNQSSTVGIDLSGIVTSGDRYYFRDSGDLFFTAVASGIYTGTGYVNVPLPNDYFAFFLLTAESAPSGSPTGSIGGNFELGACYSTEIGAGLSRVGNFALDVNSDIYVRPIADNSQSVRSESYSNVSINSNVSRNIGLSLESLASNLAFDSTVTEAINGNSIFVSPSGSMGGLGTIDSPWSFSGVLMDTGVLVHPGDTIYMRSGIYSCVNRGTNGTFFMQLSGSKEAPIVIRPYNHERATVDGSIQNRVSPVGKRISNVIISGLEFWLSESTGTIVSSDFDSSASIARPYGGIYITTARNVQIINNIFHGTLYACYLWSQVESGLVYGNIFYNNGYIAQDDNHGETLYMQNVGVSQRRVIRNAFFKNYHYNVAMNGSSSASINNILYSGNIASSGLGNIINNVSDNRVSIGGQGELSGRNSGWIISSNINVGTPLEITVSPYSGANVEVYNNQQWLTDMSATTGGLLGLVSFAGNLDYDTGVLPLVPLVHMLTNDYESGRANVSIQNFPQVSSVAVALTGIVSSGDAYFFRDSGDFWDTAVVSGIYDGTGYISLPLGGRFFTFYLLQTRSSSFNPTGLVSANFAIEGHNHLELTPIVQKLASFGYGSTSNTSSVLVGSRESNVGLEGYIKISMPPNVLRTTSFAQEVEEDLFAHGVGGQGSLQSQFEIDTNVYLLVVPQVARSTMVVQGAGGDIFFVGTGVTDAEFGLVSSTSLLALDSDLNRAGSLFYGASTDMFMQPSVQSPPPPDFFYITTNNANLQQYDWGSTLLVQTLFDNEPVFIGNSTDVQMIFQKPDRSVIIKDANLFSGGIDGRVYYTVESGTLDQLGLWQVQSYTRSPSGTWYSDIYKFRVHRN